jgi:hypothetical protein
MGVCDCELRASDSLRNQRSEDPKWDLEVSLANGGFCDCVLEGPSSEPRARQSNRFWVLLRVRSGKGNA